MFLRNKTLFFPFWSQRTPILLEGSTFDDGPRRTVGTTLYLRATSLPFFHVLRRKRGTNHVCTVTDPDFTRNQEIGSQVLNSGRTIVYGLYLDRTYCGKVTVLGLCQSVTERQGVQGTSDRSCPCDPECRPFSPRGGVARSSVPRNITIRRRQRNSGYRRPRKFLVLFHEPRGCGEK